MRTRAPREADLEEVLALLQAADIALIGESDWTASDLRDEWEDVADLERDGWVVELDGRIAGHARLIDRRNRLNADGYVHPELRGRGVGSELLRLTEERARELAPDLDPPVRLQSATLVGDPCVSALYERHGYVDARHFLRMVVGLGDQPPARNRRGAAAGVVPRVPPARRAQGRARRRHAEPDGRNAALRAGRDARVLGGGPVREGHPCLR